MKNQMTILVSLLFCLNVSAQWSVGPKMGVGILTQSQSDFRIQSWSDHGLYNLRYIGGTNVKSIGLMAYRDLGPFFIQTEVLATTYGQKYSMDSFKKSDAISSEYIEEFYVVEIPVTAGVIIRKNFKLGVGHILEILADKNSELSQFSYYRDTSNKIDHGFQMLIGYRLGALHLDVIYIDKFNSISDSFNFGNDEMKLEKSANRLTLSLGVTF